MPEEWKPLSVRERGREDFSEALVEDAPDYLYKSLWHWLDGRLSELDVYASCELVRRAERVLRTDLLLPPATYVHPGDYLRKALGDSAAFLDFVDYFIGHAGISGEELRALDALLEEAGSAWAVTFGKTPHLSRRVLAESKATVERVSTWSQAGEHMGNAWRSAFGRGTNPQHAYDEAVRAVEAAAHSTVSPRNTKATLGTMIADLRNKPDKWEVHLPHEQPSAQVETLAGMMELLWKGQYRHGDDTGAKKPNSQEQSETAVHLALALVELFHSGSVASNT